MYKKIERFNKLDDDGPFRLVVLINVIGRKYFLVGIKNLFFGRKLKKLRKRSDKDLLS
jgi:hypothetical protein